MAGLCVVVVVCVISSVAEDGRCVIAIVLICVAIVFVVIELSVIVVLKGSYDGFVLITVFCVVVIICGVVVIVVRICAVCFRVVEEVVSVLVFAVGTADALTVGDCAIDNCEVPVARRSMVANGSKPRVVSGIVKESVGISSSLPPEPTPLVLKMKIAGL